MRRTHRCIIAENFFDDLEQLVLVDGVETSSDINFDEVQRRS